MQQLLLKTSSKWQRYTSATLAAAAATARMEVQSLCVASFPVDSFAIRSNLMAADNPVLFSYVNCV